MPQRNLGERKYYLTRPPVDIARAFEKELAHAGLKASPFLANILADRYALQRPTERFRANTSVVSEEQGTLALGNGARRRVKPAAPKAQYCTRLPQDVAAAFEAELAGASGGIACSQFIADILAARYGLPLASLRSARNGDQGVLPIAQAS